MPKIKKKKVKTKSLENLLAYKSKKGIVQIGRKTSEKFPEIQITPSSSKKIFNDAFCLSNSNPKISLDFESSVENLVVNYDENAENFVEHDSSDNKSNSENSVLSDFNSTILDKTNR
jgi:hypothetical protein